MPLLSIIVPIYNVEKYIKKCLDSIKRQTMTDFEALLIDDGSTDRSGEIAEEYAAGDSRFIVIHQKNQGLSGARNTGLRIAQGKYIGSVDPDDWILPEMYDRMINEAKQMDADIFCCSWMNAGEDGTIKSKHVLNLTEHLMDRKEFLIHLFDCPKSIGASFWNKIFKHSWISEEFNTRFCLGEDWVFLFENSRYKEYHVGYISCPLYVYRERADSLMHNNISSYVSAVDAEKSVLLICRDMDNSIYQAAQRHFLDTGYRLCKMYKEDECFEEETIVGIILKKHICNNIKQIVNNSQIYWKTRILYLLWYIKNLGNYNDYITVNGITDEHKQ